MLLRITYSNTKMFFKRTIESFKSNFPRGYQRLPKTPPCNPLISCTGNRGANRLHASHFTHSYKVPKKPSTDHHKKSAGTRKEAIRKYIVDSKKQETMNNMIMNNHDEKYYYNGKYEEELSKCLVTRKLTELKMMEGTNVDLVHDIEEVLHYYSRLTCPVYRDIMDKFFLQMYSGTFNLSGVDNSVRVSLNLKAM